MPPASAGWRANKPGVPDSPNDPEGFGPYAAVGPDPGWAVKLVRTHDLPDDHGVPEVVTGLTMTRAALFGRAAVRRDIEAALAILGYGYEPRPEVLETRQRWLADVPGEMRPGELAVAEVDRVVLKETPDHIRWLQSRRDRS
jgi:hypothetical protein